MSPGRRNSLLPGWGWNLDTARGDGLENMGGGGMGPMSLTDIGGSGRTERSISPSCEGTSSTSGRFNRETLCITGMAKEKENLLVSEKKVVMSMFSIINQINISHNIKRNFKKNLLKILLLEESCSSKTAVVFQNWHFLLKI